MPKCTTCGNHVTHEYVRVFGDNENSIDSCRNCRSSARWESESTDDGPERVVYLDDLLEDPPDRENEGADGENAIGDGDLAPDPAPAASGDASAGTEPSGGRSGLDRLRALFGQ